MGIGDWDKEAFGNNRIVYMDNYYTTVRLAKYFTSQKTGLIGTIRKNRIKLDKNSPLPERHGQYSFFINKEQDMTLVIYYIFNIYKNNYIINIYNI